MKSNRLLLRSLLPATTLGILSVSAQPLAPDLLISAVPESRNHLDASFRMAFNVSTRFKNVGAFTPGNTRLTPDGDRFNYDDGYVLTDSTGNLMGYTRYWGYDYDSGAFSQLPGDGTILMHRNSSTGVSASGKADEPQLGLELAYSRELGRNEKVRWGFETALNYMNVSVHDSRALSAGVTRLTDAYALPGLEGGGFVSPPPAPYSHGTELSPEGNPVIGATPVSSSTDTVMGDVTGSRRFEAHVFGWRLGPYIEMPLGRNGRLTLSGGLALAYVNSDFNFRDSVALTGVPSLTGGGNHDGLQVGGYVSGGVSYKLGRSYELFGNVQFQHVGTYSHREYSRAAVLDLSKTVAINVGINYSF